MSEKTFRVTVNISQTVSVEVPADNHSQAKEKAEDYVVKNLEKYFDGDVPSGSHDIVAVKAEDITPALKVTYHHYKPRKYYPDDWDHYRIYFTWRYSSGYVEDACLDVTPSGFRELKRAFPNMTGTESSYS